MCLSEAQNKVSDLEARAVIAKQRISILEQELERGEKEVQHAQQKVPLKEAKAQAGLRTLQVPFKRRRLFVLPL